MKRTGLFLLLLAAVVVVGGAVRHWASSRGPAAPLVRRSPVLGEAVGISEPSADPTQRPNVVLISLDTVRPDHLGCYGYSVDTTPSIDALAGQGVRFTAARSQSPWTLTSHMSLFTSMLPSTNGVEGLNQVLSEGVPLLAEILQQHGYQTAALVNNGQMRSHWGFSRGFDLWREFDVDTPQGDCEHITDEALKWIAAEPKQPFLLFLHYYDAHDPYDPPEDLRRRFNTSLVGERARQLLWTHRFPDQDLHNRKLLDELIAAYDAEIARVDRQLARLLAELPPDTLVVIFSDHGESFEEHGWTLHGATLYEQEIRVVLAMRHPTLLPAGRVIGESVMLLDVAPTILRLCGAPSPPGFEGRDLMPLIESGQVGADRLHLAETKAVLEGRASKAAILGPWKLIYDQFGGPTELYRLPDEHANLMDKEPEAAAALWKAMLPWVRGDDYWMVHAHGEGEFEAELELGAGQFVVFVPVDWRPPPRGNEQFEVSDQGRKLRWRTYPQGQTRSLYVQAAPRDAPIRFDLRINGQRQPNQVWLGRRREQPAALPCRPMLEGDESEPAIEHPFQAQEAGFYVLHHRSESSSQAPQRAGSLDPETIRQLRALGYVK